MIETERLRLRPLTLEQAGQVVAGDRAGQAWSAGYPRDDDRDVARMALAHPAAEPSFGPLQIVTRDAGLVVGGIGFFGPPDADGVVELGYGVAPEAEGRGYATEALRGLLRYAFVTGRVRRAIADTTHGNVGSQRVMEKAGMRRTRSDERLRYYEATAPAA
ncbi:GNAT family N-acetyltransferase [Catellatospora sp. IY07-71]|uniref:GNAT family N-acetyltransferase n=1 Tax=Catellatospora sp. IY07-71 TaxID=2728827 RepID=UPI001FD5F6D4|nr:GNAT family N-acetyltransferase [Catellatospora sp. IY07-71]